MLLCIDCGNTNTVFSIWDGREFLCTLRTSTHHARTADAYFTWYSTLIKHYGIDTDITDVIISSTVPRVVFNLRVFSDRSSGADRWWWGGPSACCRSRRGSMPAPRWGRTGWSIPPAPSTAMAAI